MGIMKSGSCRNAQRKRFWQVHIRAWKKSGLSQNEYCRRNQLSNSRFGYWKKKLRQGGPPSLNLVPIRVAHSQMRTGAGKDDSGLTIVLGNNMRIRLENDFSSSALNKVVAVLEGRS